MSTKFHRSGKNVLAQNDAKAYMDHLTDAFLFINSNYGIGYIPNRAGIGMLDSYLIAVLLIRRSNDC